MDNARTRRPGAHPECLEGERCIGNWTHDEFARLDSPTKRMGKIPYDHDGSPHKNAEDQFPVFVHIYEPLVRLRF